MIDNTAIGRRDSARAEHARLTERYIAAGGSIQRLETTDRAPYRRHSYNDKPVSSAENKRRAFEQRRERLIERVRQLAAVEIEGIALLRTADEIARIMRQTGDSVSALSVEQLAARAMIELKAPRKAQP